MEELDKKVISVLKAAFPSAEIDLQDDDGIIGVLVSNEFEGVEAIDRQNKIWKVLDRSLAPEEKRRIHIIVAATPEEHIGHASTR